MYLYLYHNIIIDRQYQTKINQILFNKQHIYVFNRLRDIFCIVVEKLMPN